MSVLRGFITNLGLYNEGQLVGEWIDFPVSDLELEEVKKRIGIDDDYEEWFFTDYECDLDCFDASNLEEYESIETLNEIGEKLLDVYDRDLDNEVNAGIEYGLKLDDAIQKALDGEIIFIGEQSSDNDEVIAHNYIDSLGGLEELSEETLSQYIDFEALGRDVRLEYYKDDDDMPETAGEYWTGDENASDEEIGEAIIDQLGVEGINNKEYFFDYSSFGRDIRIDGSFVETSSGIYEILD